MTLIVESMSSRRLVIAIGILCFILDIHCADDEEDDIFQFSTKKVVPINAPSTSSSKKSNRGDPNNPFNGIQELSNQFKDGNINNLKKISDSNANTVMNILGLGSNWMGTNLRLVNQWNDLNRDLGEKLIRNVHKMHDSNLRFIKGTVENSNNNIKATLDPISKQISDVRDTFNANPNDKDDSSNSLSLVSKSGRPVETMAEITNELPASLVNGTGWFGG